MMPTNTFLNSPDLAQAFHMRAEIYFVLYELNDSYEDGRGIEVGNNVKITHSLIIYVVDASSIMCSLMIFLDVCRRYFIVGYLWIIPTYMNAL